MDGEQRFKDTGCDSGERKRASVTAHIDALQVARGQRPAECSVQRAGWEPGTLNQIQSVSKILDGANAKANL